MLAALSGRTEVLEWLLQNTKNVTDVLENKKNISGVPENTKNVTENVTKNVAMDVTNDVTGVLDRRAAHTTNQMVSLSRYKVLAYGMGGVVGGDYEECVYTRVYQHLRCVMYSKCVTPQQ